MRRSQARGRGMRERKKQATRRALSWAAVRLAVECGFDNVLVEDIAAEVGVSPRTFNNYFSSKAEAIGARHLDHMLQIAEALRARPATEPLWIALTCAVVSEMGGSNSSPDPEWTAGVRLMLREPALEGALFTAGAAGQRELAAAVATRTATDADRDLYPRLVAAAVIAAIATAIDQWLAANPTVPLTPLLHDALTQLAAGLPAPFRD